MYAFHQKKKKHFLRRNPYIFHIRMNNEAKTAILIGLFFFLSSSDSSSSSGGDQTDLLSGGSSSFDGRSLSDVLMVTASVRMLNGVHGNTSNLWPTVSLHLKILEF